MQNFGDKGDEGKEPSSLGAACMRAVVGVERYNLGMQAHLGDEGDEGKESSSSGPHVGAAVGVERCSWRMQI
jgi:hypothetical protein